MQAIFVAFDQICLNYLAVIVSVNIHTAQQSICCVCRKNIIPSQQQNAIEIITCFLVRVPYALIGEIEFSSRHRTIR